MVDVSVGAKWFLPSEREQFHSAALKLFADFTAGSLGLVVPDLFWAEFGNVCWKAVRRGRWTAFEARTALLESAALTLETIPSRSFIPRAFEIAHTHGCSVYDGIYVALTAETAVPLITADERLARAVGGEYPVRWLGSL